MGIFSLSHEWGEVVHTIPAVQKCERCGIYRRAGAGDLDDLPHGIKFSVLPDKMECQKSEYTQFQIDNARESAYKLGWVEGQDKGIHLQDEFSREFFKTARLNPTTKVYEITVESYQIIKDKLARQSQPTMKETK